VKPLLAFLTLAAVVSIPPTQADLDNAFA